VGLVGGFIGWTSCKVERVREMNFVLVQRILRTDARAAELGRLADRKREALATCWRNAPLSPDVLCGEFWVTARDGMPTRILALGIFQLYKCDWYRAFMEKSWGSMDWNKEGEDFNWKCWYLHQALRALRKVTAQWGRHRRTRRHYIYVRAVDYRDTLQVLLDHLMERKELIDSVTVLMED